ncbi:alpha/beta-hydrolase [Hypoxylon sp. FL1150]|nr:alpha/beta-hydrolase [Hypoxylon sp. FL1150]
MSSTSNLAVIICHGSYHSPAPYLPFVEALKAKGIEAYCPQLPTADLTKLNAGDINNPDFDRDPPSGGYPQGEEDTEVVLDVLRPVVSRGKQVLIIAHWAGGWVAAEAARPALQAKSRKDEGLAGGIIGILFMGAFIITPKDGSFVTPPFMRFHKHGGAGLGTMVEPEKFLFNNLDEAEAKKWAATLTASPILTTKLSNDAYAALPCAYLVLEGDRTLPKEYQEGMVAGQSQKTGAFTMYHCEAGHSPHLSWTDGLVNTVQDFVKKIEV